MYVASSNSDQGKANEGIGEAALFEAISHPTRIRILFALESDPLGFSSLKRNVGLSSSGNLQHHIGKLGNLILINSDSDYSLSDQGQEALIAVKSVRNMQNLNSRDVKTITFVTTLGFYLVQMNIPFLFGTVNELTPLIALTGAFFFSLFFYPMYSWNYSRKRNKDAKSN